MMRIYRERPKSSLVNRPRYHSFCIPVIVFMLACFIIQAESLSLQSAQNWIVLPDFVNPYTGPSLETAKTDLVLKYPEQIREINSAGSGQALPTDWVCFEKEGLNQDWVAKPGHSEHQLGTTVDLCSPDPASAGHQSFGLSKEGLWLKAHAEHCGFKQSYTQDKKRFTGYQSEPWHYRFIGFQ